ncbi:glutathione S-transferase family protein [Phenylobacterium sp.]|uniref:glutathione S-transferase family protein n=1 Tax=Phenylobacterium sp. TaxID=1871053 RepID=UPI003BAD940E
MIKLYSFPGTVSLAVHIALEEAGAAYELVKVDFMTNAQRSPEFLAINPKSRVPALATERGVLTEAPALLTYVAQTFPEANLAPLDDPFAMAQVQAFNTYLCSWVHPAAAHRHRGYRWADDPAAIADMRRKAPEVFADGMAVIEAEYLRGPWVMGEAYSICDPYLFTVAGWLPRDGIDMARFPRIAEHFARMGERPAVRKVLAQLAV